MRGVRMTTLVSVLICAYNVEKYIDECLNAVIAQTYKNLEIIVVNDGSTDGTLAKLRQFEAKDPRVKIIDNIVNQGTSKSLNIGIQYCQGEIIARTDSDDIVDIHWIETLMRELDNSPETIAISAYLEFLAEKGNGSKLSRSRKHGKNAENPISSEAISQRMLFGNPVHNNVALVRRKVFSEYGLRFDPDYIHAEDYKFWFEVSKLGKMRTYPKALVKYRLHATQVSSAYNQKQRSIAKKIKREAISHYLQQYGIQLPEKLTIHDLFSIFSPQIELSLTVANKQELFWSLATSLSEYHFRDLLKIYSLDIFHQLSFKYKKRIFRKFLLPNRYPSVI